MRDGTQFVAADLNGINQLIRRLRTAEALAAARIEQIPTEAKMVMVCTDLVMRPELREQFEEFSERIKKRCTSGQWTLVAFFPEATDIKTMDDEQLSAAGLMRVPRQNSVITDAGLAILQSHAPDGVKVERGDA